ncbi:ATP-binding protein [Conexibacter stalactiti]|uniref:histidine kinase n=1 Tax=Conexibacter stalactiti TaxID=1940611 RepID=A0ABU4HJR4_9ACTN|nr:ATP-binding protein [Conexibacter stalactiti]MDW5593545.1 ATP-binding protein [Conexibacter stalactiti]MEC5034186.1 ATP-binding protein [Conexibacter stalactiti]
MSAPAVAVAGGPSREAVRMWALIRLAALPAIYLGERLVAHPSPRSDPFGPLLAAATVYALLTLALAYWPRAPQLPARLLALLDVAFLWALTYTSGGPYSQLRYAFFLLPIGAALLLRPALTAAASLAVVVAYLAIALLYPTEDAADFELTQALYLVWMGIVAVLLARVLARRSDEVQRLSADRGRLVAQALDAEDRERRRLAGALHDDAVQNLLAARHELAGGGDLAFVQHGLDRTIAQLRDAVFDLYPAALDHAGLAAALEAVAEHAGRRAGFDWQVEVDEQAAGAYDQLLFSLARELIINVAKHANAAHVTVRVRQMPAELQLEVADDGRGLDPARLRRAPLDGHIGLASATERVEALDGVLEIASEPGQGTLVRVRIPHPS